ncbi:hypothetical protein T4D_13550 [Trichinella pseudospiralis]|uniref:Uncharacterized protein n=1 Tax=Trichinella pseudospiralis TaxID=6337 RepID=A0A0V1G1Q1_TRIPS|nr:hypothetical protein T4D_13550 [Trichinella pseudospiralis]
MKRSTNQIHSSCSQTQLRQCHFDAEYCLFENVQLILTNFRIRSRKAPQFKQNKNSERNQICIQLPIGVKTKDGN